MRPRFPRRSALVSVLAGVALVCGPLSSTPAQAADLSVTGVVVDTAGQPVADASIAVWVKDEDEGAFVPDFVGTETDARGRYALDLEPGTYRFGVFADERYVSEYYNDATRLKYATSVVVSDAPVRLDTVELELLPTIEGSVRTPSGAPVPYSYVMAITGDATTGWDSEHVAEVEPDGTYSMPVEPGTYRIGFFDEDDDYRAEYWDDAPSIAGAKDVVVGARGVTGIDAVLTPMPVTPPTYRTIQNFSKPRAEGYAAVNTVMTSVDGTWSYYPAVFSRQWLRNGTPIPGATDARYRVTAADLGASLSVQVTAYAPSMNSASVTSDPVGPIRWHTKIDATSRPGRKKATVTVKVTSHGPVPNTGTVQLRLRGKIVRTAAVRNGRAVFRFSKLPKTKVRYDAYFFGDESVYGARDAVWVRFKKPSRK
ncbi:carboxypeptidase regulatory-like domain-containing protein [Aeromicrobium sp. CFBP 8757]|uniref:carboxypeptidase regulatory-like domain-containing protein n=1 Tax=Aeromicrobium sp. CFBP 8757 TaxID=2775288 RepID=UPI00177E8996|nr:carboxypeptidase regulatory-like domain-containing protein [Aeromicrobium sp. CFBP 8757]